MAGLPSGCIQKLAQPEPDVFFLDEVYTVALFIHFGNAPCSTCHSPSHPMSSSPDQRVLPATLGIGTNNRRPTRSTAHRPNGHRNATLRAPAKMRLMLKHAPVEWTQIPNRSWRGLYFQELDDINTHGSIMDLYCYAKQGISNHLSPFCS